MAMTSRERMLTALANGRPDRLPCQVHGWMPYYLKNYLGGMDEWQAFERFGMDYAIYVSPSYSYDEKDRANWLVECKGRDTDESGNRCEMYEITTPKGKLRKIVVHTDVTSYYKEHVLKDLKDFEIWNEYYPVPRAVDFSRIQAVKDRLRDKGIIRSHPFSPGQGSPWQSFCTLFGTETSIMLGMDEPDTLHHILESILQKTLRVTEMWKGTPATARKLVLECFEATKDHAGYILCPSDHFFHGDPACLQAFADAARECEYG